MSQQPMLGDARTFASAHLSHDVPLSQRLWGLDWSKHTPWQFDDVTVVSARFEDALPFVDEHYAQIFGTAERGFLSEAMTEAKQRFCSLCDVFLFQARGKTVGVLTSNPGDWSTYYMRSCAVLPEYRDRGLMAGVCIAMEEPLRSVGV